MKTRSGKIIDHTKKPYKLKSQPPPPPTLEVTFLDLMAMLDERIVDKYDKLEIFMGHELPHSPLGSDVEKYIEEYYGPIVKDARRWQEFFKRNRGLQVTWMIKYPMDDSDYDWYEEENWPVMRKHLMEQGNWVKRDMRPIIETLMGAEQLFHRGIPQPPFTWNMSMVGILKYKVPKTVKKSEM